MYVELSYGPQKPGNQKPADGGVIQNCRLARDMGPGGRKGQRVIEFKMPHEWDCQEKLGVWENETKSDPSITWSLSDDEGQV